MKHKTILWKVLILFAAFSGTSCDRENREALALHEVENHAIKLYYGSKGGVTVTGGNGKYSFSCESPLLNAEMTSRNYIALEPLGVGDARLTVTDSSGESYVLDVSIVYKTEYVTISKLEATVAGDGMTVAEQKELKAKALETIPVKAGGGYKLVYTRGDEQPHTEGPVIIYPETFGRDGIEGTFERTIATPDDGAILITYTLHYSNTRRTFTLKEYNAPVTRTSPADRFQWYEDLTEQYQTDYPALERVYTAQIIGSTNTE